MLSIDGPEAFHDACHVDKRGERSFRRVMVGLHALQARDGARDLYEAGIRDDPLACKGSLSSSAIPASSPHRQ